MRRSKKIFVGLAAIFLLLLVYVSYDISQRTTFPGSRPQLRERLKHNGHETDTLKKDTTAEALMSELKEKIIFGKNQYANVVFLKFSFKFEAD